MQAFLWSPSCQPPSSVWYWYTVTDIGGARKSETEEDEKEARGSEKVEALYLTLLHSISINHALNLA